LLDFCLKLCYRAFVEKIIELGRRGLRGKQQNLDFREVAEFSQEFVV